MNEKPRVLRLFLIMELVSVKRRMDRLESVMSTVVADLRKQCDEKDNMIAALCGKLGVFRVPKPTIEVITLGSESSGSRDSSPEREIAVPASPISKDSKVRNSEEDDEDYVYEEERPTKRRKRDDDKAKKPRGEANGEKQKAIVAEQKRRKWEAAQERQRKQEEKRQEKVKKDEARKKMEEAKRALQQQAAAQQINRMAPRVGSVDLSIPEQPKEAKADSEKRKRRKTDTTSSRWRDIQAEGDNQDDPAVSQLVKKILEESKKKEASSQEVEEEDLTPEIIERKPFDYSKTATKYCKVCKKGTHYTFASLFEHYQDHHHAELKSFSYYGYFGKSLIGKKLLLERDYCQRCVTKFPRARDYYSHMIQFHIHESVRCQLDFENADNADVEVRMLFRERIITLGYNFKFDDDVNFASSSTSDIVDYRAGTLNIAAQPTFLDKQIKQEPPQEMPTEAEQYPPIKLEPHF